MSENEHSKANERLQAGGRLPITIWGDIMLDGSPPQVRRVITGQDGHECLLSFFYLNEILTLNEIVRALPALQTADNRPASLPERFFALKGYTPDPQNHINNEIINVFFPIVSTIKSIGWENTEICELGCTFFSAIDKTKIIASLMDVDIGNLTFSAIDHSDFFMRGAMMFHPEDNIVPYNDYALWKPTTKYPFHLSRFVSSFAVPDTKEMATWMENFSIFHIIDVISLDDAEIKTSNNGLNQIFFNFPLLVEEMSNAGWDIYINDISPDFNSGRPCAIVKLFGIRRTLDSDYKVIEKITAVQEMRSTLPFRKIGVPEARSIISETRNALSDQEWDGLAAYKQHFPIWGRPFTPIHDASDVTRLTRPPALNLDLRFESGQINFYARKAIEDSQKK